MRFEIGKGKLFPHCSKCVVLFLLACKSDCSSPFGLFLANCRPLLSQCLLVTTMRMTVKQLPGKQFADFPAVYDSALELPLLRLILEVTFSMMMMMSFTARYDTATTCGLCHVSYSVVCSFVTMSCFSFCSVLNSWNVVLRERGGGGGELLVLFLLFSSFGWLFSPACTRAC